MERALQIALAAAFVVLIVLVAFPFHSCGCSPNEHPAIANLRTINTAEVTYLSSSSGSYGTIADLIAAGLLDDSFTGIKSGYKYSITLNETGSAYTAEAVPAAVVPKSYWWSSSTPSNNTRRYAYYTVPDQIVRYSTNVSLAPTAEMAGKSVQ